MLFLVNSDGREGLAVLEDGKVRVPDGGSFVAGTGNDLQIYHDPNFGGSPTSFIKDQTGDLRIESSVDDLILRAEDDVIIQGKDDISLTVQNGQQGVFIRGNGEVQLHHRGTQRLETTNTGVSITDNL